MTYMTWLAPVLRDAGLIVHEKPGWETRGTDSMKPGGVVNHHTGGRAPTSISAYVDFLIRGRSDLPGPLCHLYLDRNAEWWVLAAGRANHAGVGRWKGLVGNSSVVGIEAGNDGYEPWPPEQVQSWHIANAAICSQLKLSPDMVCGHKEWSPGRKPDPHTLDMNLFRASVAEQMGALYRTKPSAILLPEEVAAIRQWLDALESIGSNPGYVIPIIADYRQRTKP